MVLLPGGGKNTFPREALVVAMGGKGAGVGAALADRQSKKVKARILHITVITHR